MNRIETKIIVMVTNKLAAAKECDAKTELIEELSENLYQRYLDLTAAGVPEQEALRDYNYGKDFKYDEDWSAVRKGLICAFPKDELVMNTALDVNLHDPNLGQNPQEVFWK